MESASAAVSRKVMLGYGVGQVGAQIFRDAPAVLLPIFMVTMLGIPAWLAGFVVLLPKLWVIVCDPLVGSLSDRMRPRHGRSPIMALGAVLTACGFFALFSFQAFPSPNMAAAAICLIYLLASTGFSAFSVPYLALAAELSADPHERTKILVFRMIFTIAGVMLGVGVAQPMVFYFGGGGAGWRTMAVAFALICFVAMMTTAVALRRVATIGHSTTLLSMREQLSLARRNRPFVLLTMTHFLQGIGSACGYSVVGMVFIYAVGNIKLLPIFVLVMSGAGLLSQPFWLKMSRLHGKLRMFVWASAVWALLTCTWILVGKAKGIGVALPFGGVIPLEELLVLLRAFVIGVVNSGFVLLAVSMLTDTINHGRGESGAAVEGSLAGLWSASEKLAFAVGPAIGGVVLSLSGFTSSKGGVVTQNTGTVTGILLIYSLIPASFCLASLLLLRGYSRAFTGERSDLHPAAGAIAAR